jgi:large subunit ribosomal protein L16
MTAQQIEAARIAINRKVKRGGQMWIRVFPAKPLTRKPAETRMGGGKGSPELWVAPIRPGKILYELAGVEESLAVRALTLAANKLPFATKVISKEKTI